MKRTFKALVVAIIFTLIISVSALPAYATYDEANTPVNSAEVSAEQSVEVNDDIEQANPSELVTDDELAENLFTAIFNQVKSYATEIFCAMTFIGSLILAYAYKKGLMPLIEKTLISIGGSVAKIKERTESGAIATEELGASLTAKLETSEVVINNMIEKINEMNQELSQIKTSELERTDSCKELSIIVNTQIDMLYDIFMTSALPQYQKDAVGERVAKMKEMLKDYDKEKQSV